MDNTGDDGNNGQTRHRTKKDEQNGPLQKQQGCTPGSYMFDLTLNANFQYQK